MQARQLVWSETRSASQVRQLLISIEQETQVFMIRRY